MSSWTLQKELKRSKGSREEEARGGSRVGVRWGGGGEKHGEAPTFNCEVWKMKILVHGYGGVEGRGGGGLEFRVWANQLSET